MTLLLIYIITASLSSVAVNANVLIMDSFETMDMSATNSDGFAWGNNNRTSIVTQHPDDGNVVVFNGNPVYITVNDDRDWTAFDGDYSLRFRYSAGQNLSEQRFNLGGSYPEIWIRYWLRVPVNFKHNTGNTNNKLLALWMDGYEYVGYGPTIVWQYRNDGSNGSNTMYYKMQNTGALDDSNGQRHSTELQSQPFITYPDDQGRWMQVVFRVKSSSSATASDGIVQMYRRWQNENTFTLLHEELDVPLLHAPAGINGFKQGYLMGWANAPYDSDTEWLLDDFTVSETSLLLSNEDLIFANGFDSN